MISLDSCKRALSSLTSANKHYILALEEMLTRASVAIFLSFIASPNWSNKFLNLELCCKVVIAGVGRARFSSSSSPGSAHILPLLLHPSPYDLGVGFFEPPAGTALKSLL